MTIASIITWLASRGCRQSLCGSDAGRAWMQRSL